MNISAYVENDRHAIETFKSSVWPAADAEHYGDNQPQFFKKEITLLAKEEGNIVGYVTLHIDSGVAQVEPLMVAVDRQNQGIGSALLKAAEKEAKEHAVHKVWLETGADWKARTFYEKNGFTLRSILPNHTGGREFILFDKMI
jgi:GNAT superfamily N-acetyltransferase